uniref:WW domain-containing protein n=1 Tax=Schistocephalus solidus TaxID=70667 RepID=A0A183TN47_SCHSO
LNPRIPAGSLLWGIATLEYNWKTGLRKHALTVLDVACLYGKDLRSLSYRQRMHYVGDVARVVNLEDGDQSNIIVPPLVTLRDLDSFIKGLPVLSCKDRPEPGPMVATVKNYACIPSTLYLATHLAFPWIELKSSKTGQFYYFNRNSNVSTYTLPQEAILPYGRVSSRPDLKVNSFSLVLILAVELLELAIFIGANRSARKHILVVSWINFNSILSK